MASYYEAKKSAVFTGTHICSKCGSLVFSDFEFYAIARSRWTMKKANEGAEAAAEQGLTALKNSPQKPFLVTCVSENNTYSLVSGFGINGLTHSCPYCGNQEPWQMPARSGSGCTLDPETGVTLIPNIPVKSRLYVCFTKEQLALWQQETLKLLASEYQEHWAAQPDEAQRLRDQIKALKANIESLTAYLGKIHESSDSITQQILQKQEVMKSHPLFSAERKACKAEVKELQKQYETQRDAEVQQKNQLLKNIQELKDFLMNLMIQNPGVLADVQTFTSEKGIPCTAYRIC